MFDFYYRCTAPAIRIHKFIRLSVHCFYLHSVGHFCILPKSFFLMFWNYNYFWFWIWVSYLCEFYVELLQCSRELSIVSSASICRTTFRPFRELSWFCLTIWPAMQEDKYIFEAYFSFLCLEKRFPTSKYSA